MAVSASSKGFERRCSRGLPYPRRTGARAYGAPPSTFPRTMIDKLIAAAWFAARLAWTLAVFAVRFGGFVLWTAGVVLEVAAAVLGTVGGLLRFAGAGLPDEDPPPRPRVFVREHTRRWPGTAQDGA